MIALPQRLARRLEAQALEAGFDRQVLQRKVGGVNGKEVNTRGEEVHYWCFKIGSERFRLKLTEEPNPKMITMPRVSS
jgi:hypothetical protein